MRRTIHKLFWVWNFDKEEKWLNEMAAKGLCLVSVGFCKYEFEDCAPGEYKVRLQLLENHHCHPESQKYIEFVESTEAEHVGSLMRWVYFRKKTACGDFVLFSDYTSRVKYISSIISFIWLIMIANLLVGINNIFLAVVNASLINYLGVINVMIAIPGIFGNIRLIRKRGKIKQEGQLFE